MGEMCRICMTAKKDLVKLVNERTNTLERSGEKFEDCFGLKITEISYCQKICKNCELQLIDFYYFKQQAIRTHHYLLDKAVGVLEESDLIKDEMSDEENLSDNEEEAENNTSDVEFFNIEYLDEDAVHVDMINLPLPMTEQIANMEIKQEKIDYEDSMENAPSENLEEETYDAGSYERQFELFNTEVAEESQEESVGISASHDNENDQSEKDSREESPKKPIIRYFKRSRFNNRHECHQCRINFKSLQAYRHHLKKHREEDGLSPVTQSSDPNNGAKGIKNRILHYKYTCEECGKKFAFDFSYEAHKNVHKGLPPYNCKLCGKGFKQRAGLTYHMKNHYGERDFKCEICSKAFLARWDLLYHMRQHTDSRPFMCDICGKGFRIRSHLTHHSETHNETNLFECHICHAKLHTRITLKGHLGSVHKIGHITKCQFCGQDVVRYFLKDHEKKCKGVAAILAKENHDLIDVI